VSAAEPVAEAGKRRRGLEETFTQEQLDDGIVLNAAVLLKDATPRAVAKTQGELTKALNPNPKDPDIKIVDWRIASGRLGQFVGVIGAVLAFAVFVIFLVLLIVMFSAVLMATLQRVKEFGTVRAIGGRRRFVLGMVFFESLVLGLVFGGGGALIGLGIVWLLHARGIPATTDQLYFFFAGPKLHPDPNVATVVFGFVLVTFVTILSTLYPAYRATTVSPIRAMQAED